MISIEYKSLDEISPYEGNPRNNKEAVEPVAKSISDFGFKVPIIVDSKGIIIAGHTRYEAAKLLGMSNVPCVVASDLTEEQAKALRIADNKTGEQASWNFFKLSKELAGIEQDMADFGFTEAEMENLNSLAEDFYQTYDDEEPDEFVQSEPVQFYKPNVTPSETSKSVTKSEFDKAASAADMRFKNISINRHNTIICPECGLEFEID